MNRQRIITHLSVNGDVCKYLFKNLSEEQARWKPCAERWSLLEVINHLYDMVIRRVFIFPAVNLIQTTIFLFGAPGRYDFKSAMTSFNWSFRSSGLMRFRHHSYGPQARSG
jgi:hypothetical protein